MKTGPPHLMVAIVRFSVSHYWSPSPGECTWTCLLTQKYWSSWRISHWFWEMEIVQCKLHFMQNKSNKKLNLIDIDKEYELYKVIVMAFSAAPHSEAPLRWNPHSCLTRATFKLSAGDTIDQPKSQCSLTDYAWVWEHARGTGSLRKIRFLQ